MKVLLIGGYPKGHDRPFHPDTISGRRLRTMVDEIRLDVIYLDLWETEEEERIGRIEPLKIFIIKHHLSRSVRCVALGRHVQTALLIYGLTYDIGVQYLPHPASRRQKDIRRLREGLEGLK